MNNHIRGADIVARTLDRAELRTIFTLSGNHIMPLFDAALETELRLVHVRHEAAAVHMADAWARRTGQCGIAMVTGGAGHTNAVAALCTAQAADSPLVLLSGHASLSELGRGSFQELRQADMAVPVTKASWTASSTKSLGHDIAKAVQIATSGRPGPVHVSLPVDLLEEQVEDDLDLWPKSEAFSLSPRGLSDLTADAALIALDSASSPLILCGPMLCHVPMTGLAARLSEAVGVPALKMESPRGINDPSLGAFAGVLQHADLIVLLGKPHDFTIRFGSAPAVKPDCKFIVIDPDIQMIERAARERGSNLILSALADASAAAECLITRASRVSRAVKPWTDEVQHAVNFRPREWATLKSNPGDRVHPVELCNAVKSVLEHHPHTTIICDGGEIGQWPQSILNPSNRIINGVAGSIGAAIPFAIATRAAEPSAPVVAIVGDGTFGFHMAEFDTAVRYNLPIIVVVGNDAGWNAEYQIQLRSYGEKRAHGCELLATRYDRVVEALGGHGELVETTEELGPAFERAYASGKPACINVMVQRTPSPIVQLPR
jgi:acetolactate synthase-1/2/3 large subunit